MLRATVVFCLYFLAMTALLTHAISADQKAKIHEHFETLGLKCIKDNVITEDDIKSLRARQIPTGDNVPCFLACMMKQIGVMDDKGMLQGETALELAKSIFDDAEELKNMEEYLHSCAPVNTEAVSDGEKGCERAMLSYKCMTENASKFGFDI